MSIYYDYIYTYIYIYIYIYIIIDIHIYYRLHRYAQKSQRQECFCPKGKNLHKCISVNCLHKDTASSHSMLIPFHNKYHQDTIILH